MQPTEQDTDTIIPAALIARLRCPVTGAPLHAVINGSGLWLRSADGASAYPVVDGIVRLQPTDRVAAGTQAAIDTRKAGVQAFYDQVGWQQADDGAFEDDARFEDTRPISAGYLSRCRLRLLRHLPASGEFLLDCASGPIAFDEYRTYSAGFQRRICVDLSEVALRAARRRLGNAGVYVLADATALPFADGSMDAVISLNTLFHVPAEQQEAAMREFVRVARPAAPVLVAYSWGESASLSRALLGAARGLAGLLRRGTARAPAATEAAPGEPVLYFHAHGRDWFEHLRLPASLQIASWKSLSVGVLRTYVRGPVSAGVLLSLASVLETLMPALMGRIGQQPLLVLHKA